MSKMRSWVNMGEAGASKPRIATGETPQLTALRPQSGRIFGQVTPRKSVMPAALMGAGTDNFRDHSLDLRTETLIRLCYIAFSGNHRTLLVGLGKQLNCSHGERHRNFQRLVSQLTGTQSLKKTVQPYLKSVNGNTATVRHFFGDLCALAYHSGHVDAGSMAGLTQAGKALGLSPKDMSHSIHRLK